MRLIKMIGLAGALALAVTAFVGASSASATQVKTCMTTAGSECQLATKGTTFTATTNNVKLKGSITNTCSGSVSGKIEKNESNNGTDRIEALITEAKFTSCSLASVTEEKLPWTLYTTKTLFGEGSMGEITGAQVTINTLGGCTFAEDETHLVTGVWSNAKPSTVTLGGSMKRIAGSAFCGSTGEITGTYTVSAVSDPALSPTTDIRIEG